MTVSTLHFLFASDMTLEKPATQKLQRKQTKPQEKPAPSCQKTGKGATWQDVKFLTIHPLSQQNTREETMSYPYVVKSSVSLGRGPTLPPWTGGGDEMLSLLHDQAVLKGAIGSLVFIPILWW